MGNFVRFFVGTPRRFLWTLGLLGFFVAVVVEALHPGVVQGAVARATLGVLAGVLNTAARAVNENFQPVVALAIVVWAIRFMWRTLIGGSVGGGKKHRR